MRSGLAFILLLLGSLLFLSPTVSSSSEGSASPSYASKVVAVTTDGSLVLAVNPDSNSLSLVDAVDLTLIAEIPVGVLPRSVTVAAGEAGLAYVANEGSDSLTAVDLIDREVAADVPVGDRPVGVALSPDGRTLAVAELGDDQIRFLDTGDLRTISTIRVADRPYALSFTPDGQYLLASHLLSGAVSVIPLRPYVTYLPAVGLALPGARLQPSSSGSLSHIAIESTSKINAADPAYADQVTVSTWPNVAPAPAILVSESGSRAYLPQTMANGQGLNTQFDTSVFPKVSVLNLESWTHQTDEHISLPETDQPVGLPWDVALTLDETELWVVNAASNDVSVIDISNPRVPRRAAHLIVGDNPRGIALSPDGHTAYINNTLAGTISVVDTGIYSVTATIPVTDIPLPPLLLNGKRLFHSSATPELARAAWISCNTCHVEGEHDGRTWLLQFTGQVPPGERPVIRRNTTSLLGMIETYPLRWSAEWDESADSEFSIRFEQFGDGLISGGMHPTLGTPNQGRSYDLDSLAAFIDSLVVPESTHRLTPAGQHGQAIFESPETGCAVCHPAPLYTDLEQHDVGTADGHGEWFGPEIDTPTLRFLYDSAPYLHDGSADTLLETLTTANPDDRHGATSHLTGEDMYDLVAYLHALPHE